MCKLFFASVFVVDDSYSDVAIPVQADERRRLDNGVTMSIEFAAASAESIAKDLKRFESSLLKLTRQRDQLETRISSEQYKARVPSHIQDKDR